MPIFERNSLGSNVKITANENYSYADMGRILSECVQNDMTLFNAVLMNDFKENTALREGTMVSSELTSFREFSVKEAWGGLKKKLQKLWEKIKGVFRTVYSKLTVWFVRNGKAFVAMNRKVLANKTGLNNCKIPVYYDRKQGVDFSKIATDLCNDAKKAIEGYKSGTGETDAESFTNSLLRSAVHSVNGMSDATASNFTEKFKENAFNKIEGKTFGELPCKVEELFGLIENGGKAMKDLRKLEKDTDRAIKEVIKSVDKKSSEKDADEASSASYKNASTACSAYERAVTITCRSCIAATRMEIGNARQVIGKLVAYSPKAENAIYEEMAWLEGADDFATADDIPAEEINADDVQSDPDVEINVTVDDDGNECSK